MNSVEIFQSHDGAVSVDVESDGSTMWASQAQIAELFAIDQSRVSRHVQSIFRDAEVDREGNMRKTHIAGADRPVVFYSLDTILAVGYRTRSGRAIEFRRWATDVLRRYDLLVRTLTEAEQ